MAAKDVLWQSVPDNETGTLCDLINDLWAALTQEQREIFMEVR